MADSFKFCSSLSIFFSLFCCFGIFSLFEEKYTNASSTPFFEVKSKSNFSFVRFAKKIIQS